MPKLNVITLELTAEQRIALRKQFDRARKDKPGSMICLQPILFENAVKIAVLPKPLLNTLNAAIEQWKAQP